MKEKESGWLTTFQYQKKIIFGVGGSVYHYVILNLYFNGKNI
jgi:hypothetical protein